MRGSDGAPMKDTAYGRLAGLAPRLAGLLCLDDFQEAARRRLPRPLYGYVAGAAEDNVSLAANRESFQDYSFLTRVMVDVSRRCQSTSIFDRAFASPFGIAPMGISALCAYRGDVVLAQAAQSKGIPAIMSGTSLIPMEQVHRAASSTWFQVYLPGATAKIAPLIDRVKDAGFETLVVTVDIPVWANRENNVRTGFAMPLRPSLRLAWDGVSRPRWLLGTFGRTLLRHGMPHFENSFATRGAPMLSRTAVRDTTGREHLTWEHLRQVRERWPGNLVIKGILSERDALIAADLGADGLIVSNHGGRQLDGAAAPLRVLPAVVERVGHRTVVMMDGGIRRGGDVLKAIALGARMVFVGRPFLYAAAIGGQRGVEHAIELLRDEVDRNLAMLGIVSLDQLSPDCLLAPHGR